VLVNNRSTINVISSLALERLKIHIQFVNALTLTIKVFNNTLAITMGTIVFLIKVGVREILATCHVVKDDIQYNLLLV